VKRKLTLACWDYDRTAALADGRVSPEGIDLNYLCLPVEETFFRMARNGEFDMSEMSLSSYVLSRNTSDRFVALPVFPSRAFRHSGVYINSNSGVTKPTDLIGKVIGVPEYQVTAAVWIRGMLEDHYGVPVSSVSYRTGGLHDPGRYEKIQIQPEGVEIIPIPSDRTLSEMLLTGEIAALYSPRSPMPFLERNPAVARLWGDSPDAEIDYFKATRIFPIMHTVIIRRDVYESDRWIAGSMYKAFLEAKALLSRRLEESAAFIHMLPWSIQHIQMTKEIMGDDYWPYGIEANRHVLEVFLKYSYDQGLAKRRYEVEELFAPETHELVLI